MSLASSRTGTSELIAKEFSVNLKPLRTDDEQDIPLQQLIDTFPGKNASNSKVKIWFNTAGKRRGLERATTFYKRSRLTGHDLYNLSEMDLEELLRVEGFDGATACLFATDVASCLKVCH